MRLFLALCSTSARPSTSMSGGMYMPKRPRRPFFKPYQPPTGLSDARPQASTVPSAAGFCSSAEPSGIQSPRLEHGVQVVQAAQLVAQLGLADGADQLWRVRGL